MIDILSIVSLAFIPGFMLLDLAYQARPYDAPRWYRLRSFLVSIAVIGGSITITMLWGKLLAGFSLFDGSALNTWGGAAVGIFTYELLHYSYHRAAHRFDWLWLAGHQMHHSTEKLDAFGANVLHPLDLFFFATWASITFFPLLGLSPEAGAIGATWIAFNAMFQHANIRTPHWLGYLIQRPESHVVHHARGRHENNYSNLPLLDMFFGTFDNPRTIKGFETGFYKGASARLRDMLAFRDVSKPSPQDAGADEAPVHQAA